MAKKTQKEQPSSQEQAENQEQISEIIVENTVDKSVYDEFTNLKFFELSGVKLNEETAKKLSELEKQVSKFEGPKSLRTQRAAIMNEQVLIVEGMPIPDEYVQIINKSINPSYYIAK